MSNVIKCTMNDEAIKGAIKAAYYAGYDSMLKRYRNEYPNNEREELDKIFQLLDRHLVKINSSIKPQEGL